MWVLGCVGVGVWGSVEINFGDKGQIPLLCNILYNILYQYFIVVAAPFSEVQHMLREISVTSSLYFLCYLDRAIQSIYVLRNCT